MNTHRTFAVATFALAAATGALAASPNAESENTVSAAALTLTTEAVVSDLVRFRQIDPDKQQPRDGEWYNVPAPLGSAVRTVGYEGSGAPAQTMPAIYRADSTSNR